MSRFSDKAALNYKHERDHNIIRYLLVFLEINMKSHFFYSKGYAGNETK